MIPAVPYTDPVHRYSRLDGDGNCIVGGMLCRGTKLKELTGCYLYADWGMGKVLRTELISYAFTKLIS